MGRFAASRQSGPGAQGSWWLENDAGRVLIPLQSITAVNDDGVVTGTVANPSNPCCQKLAASYSTKDGTTTVVSFGGAVGLASAIDAAGDFTGFASIPVPDAFVFHAFVFRHGELIDLGTLGGSFGSGLAINDSGAIVGSSTLADEQTQHAFLYERNTGMQDLGMPEGCWRFDPVAVNDKGTIVGTCGVLSTGSTTAYVLEKASSPI